MSQERARADAALCRKAQQGSAAAMEALYERYMPPVWRYVYAQVRGDVHAAEDIVSETFLTALRKLKMFDANRGSPYAWFVGIARHKLGDHWRRLRRVANGCDRPAGSRSGEAGAAEPPLLLVAAERRAQVAAAMARLADEDRLVLDWKYVDGLPVREIADRLGRTSRAIEAMLFRARQSFRTAHGRLREQAV